MYTNQSKLILAAIGVFVALSLFVFPSTSMIAYSQSENKTGKEQAQEKLFELVQKFNQIRNDSGVNLTLPQGGELSSKLQELKDSAAFKELSEKFSQAVQDLGQGNKTQELKQEAGADLNKLIQKLQDLRNNSTQ
jgi:type II secretory pathway component PulF